MLPKVSPSELPRASPRIRSLSFFLTVEHNDFTQSLGDSIIATYPNIETNSWNDLPRGRYFTPGLSISSSVNSL